jgi:hypothetical protein
MIPIEIFIVGVTPWSLPPFESYGVFRLFSLLGKTLDGAARASGHSSSTLPRPVRYESQNGQVRVYDEYAIAP